jgi:RNAse (barnase) inhibitor barstar
MLITLNAINWKNINDFYDSYCIETKAPKWFGRNLDALKDSLIGGICQITPKKIIIQNLKKNNKAYFNDDFLINLKNICVKENVELIIYNN